MPTNVTFNGSLQWTPPSAPVNSGTATFAVVSSVNAQAVGQVDVQVSDPPATVIPMPFGSINAAKVVCIKNMMSSEVGVRLNGAGSNNFNVPAGGMFMYVSPVGPNAIPISSASIVTTASPAAIEAVQFFIYGD